MSEAYDFGRQAEAFVAAKYEKNDYQILERNWIFRPAEVDIIALKNNVLAIVEVKARQSKQNGFAEESVNKKKRALLTMAANEYILRHNMDVEYRFDIAVVTKGKDGWAAKIFVDAFQAHEF